MSVHIQAFYCSRFQFERVNEYRLVSLFFLKNENHIKPRPLAQTVQEKYEKSIDWYGVLHGMKLHIKIYVSVRD